MNYTNTVHYRRVIPQKWISFVGHGLSSTWKYQKKNLPTICQSRQSRSQRTAKGGPNFGTRYTKWGDKGRGEIGVNLRSQSFQFPQGRPSFVFEGFFTLFLLFLWPVTYRQSTRWTDMTKTKEVKKQNCRVRRSTAR